MSSHPITGRPWGDQSGAALPLNLAVEATLEWWATADEIDKRRAIARQASVDTGYQTARDQLADLDVFLDRLHELLDDVQIPEGAFRWVHPRPDLHEQQRAMIDKIRGLKATVVELGTKYASALEAYNAKIEDFARETLRSSHLAERVADLETAHKAAVDHVRRLAEDKVALEAKLERAVALASFAPLHEVVVRRPGGNGFTHQRLVDAEQLRSVVA